MIFSRKFSYVSGSFYGVVIFGLAIVTMFGGLTCTAVAGDLLRGGYSMSRGSSGTPGSFTAPTATQVRQNANDVLARTSQAIQSVVSMQSAARLLAKHSASSNVPDGLVPAPSTGVGGLYPYFASGGLTQTTPGNYVVPTSWTGVNALSQKQAGGKYTVTVVQNQPDAVLYWSSFNVGKHTTLDFNQNAGGLDESKWIAFNVVMGNSVSPSQILGGIVAGGQVYVINQNGIIFRGSSQVNVHTLVASSLPLNMDLVNAGVLANPNSEFLFSALTINPAPIGTFTPSTPPPNGQYGDVTVDAGAILFSPASAASVGGRIALVGANVTNTGTIYTPDGQTILAAGLQVGFVAHNSGDPSLRGLDVYVGAISASPAATPYAGTATNNGLIEAPEGDAYMTGKTVDQMGSIESETSVSLNGRIDLLADYNAVGDPLSTSGGNGPQAGSTGGIRDLGQFQFLPGSAGIVDLGPDSVTQILPDVTSKQTVVPTQQLAKASVNIQGEAIHMESDSTLLAPSSAINLDAGTWDLTPSGSDYVTDFVHSTGQIYLDSGAEINVAGSTDVLASVTQNIVTAQLRGTELADDPLQRNGVLRGQSIQFDIREQGTYNGTPWIGSPLANLFAYAGLVEQTIGELTINGGTVTMTAGGSVVMQPGSSVNVSGGYINYAGGMVQTTQVVSDGHIYDISQATPDMVYQGIFTGKFIEDHPKYAIENTYTDPIMWGAHYEDGYVYGGNAGQILITAPSMALDGDFVATTVTGPRQLSLGPAPGTFSLTFQAQSFSSGSVIASAPAISPEVVIEPGVELDPAAPFGLDSSGNPLPLGTDRQSEVVLSPDLTSQDGFGVVTIDDGAGTIVVPAGVSWKGPAVIYVDPKSATGESPASITLEATNINVEGSITLPGGNVSVTAYNINPFTFLSYQTNSYQGAPVPAVAGAGNFVLGSSASIDTSGLIVDNRLGSPTLETTPIVTNGGSVTIDSFSAYLEAGGVINVSGGAQVSPTGKFTYGNGGTIIVETGAAPEFTSVLGGRLALGATLEGYSGAVGGSLTLQAQLIQIGGATSNPDVLIIPSDLFDQGGFASFTIDGIGATNSSGVTTPALVIAPGTQISAVVTSALARQDPTDPNELEMVPELLPVTSRPAASLTFNALGAVDQFNNVILVARGDFVLGAGAEVTTDPLGSVSITGNTVAILGSVIVPAGTISVSGNYALVLKPTQPTTALIDVDLAPGSLLSTAGTTLSTPNAYGYDTGAVLGGGSITVFGNILAESGAVLNVSGASGVFDLPESYSNLETPQSGSLAGVPYVRTQIDSNAGMITLHGDQELFTDATLLGKAGGPSAVGGTLTVESGRFYSPSQTQTPADITLVVAQSGPAIPANFTESGQAALGKVVVNTSNAEISGGNFTVDAFEAGGFDNLNLDGVVQFKGPISINARGKVTVGTGGFIYGDGGKSSIDITASYVALGMAFENPQPGALPANTLNPPSYGLDSLTVNAPLIDIGNLSLEGIGDLKLIADGGDIRGDGTLEVAGSIYMQSGQVYAPTETTFTIAAYDYTANGGNQLGSVTFVGSGTRPLPLSAGATLNVFASIINQGGTLRAPIGTINLGWDGQGAAPADADLLSGGVVPVAQMVTLEAGSITSVSAIDPATGHGIIIPYGIELNGKEWIDPSGTDITTGGVPAKSVTISGVSVKDDPGSLIDLRGGGDLYAYEFIPGAGGSADILADNGSYAIIPGYSAAYAPYAPYFNTSYNSLENATVLSTARSNLGGDAGYTNPKLSIGSQVYLTGVGTLSSGYYTLLPARYANLPGAYLVTPQTGKAPGIPSIDVDGSYYTDGFAVNAFDAPSSQPLISLYQVQPQSVVQSRADYASFYGSSTLLQGAIANHVSVPRLPIDAGQLVIEATQSITVEGRLAASTPAGGLQSLVDISSPVAIQITGPGGGGSSTTGELALNASALSAFAQGSLLIGGVRETGADGTIVNVATPSITVDKGVDLSGPDIILAANADITVDSGAQIESTSGAPTGDSSLIVNGNGVLVRVSGNLADTESRIPSATPSVAELQIGSGATIKGASVTLDSSDETSLDPAAIILAKSLFLSSGEITVELNDPGTVPATTGLVLTENVLKTLQSGATSLSLLSYSTLDFYGSGQIGGISKGQPTLGALTINAGEIDGYNNGNGSVILAAKKVLLANGAQFTPPAGAPPAGAAGSELDIDAGTIELGAYQVNVDQFATVDLNATGGILAVNTGGLAADGVTTITGALFVNGAMNLTAPVITGQQGTIETITAAGGAMQIGVPSGKSPSAAVAGGLGASLTFVSAMGITDNGDIAAPSGSLKLEAQAGDLVIGNANTTTLNAAGTSKSFFDLTQYTNGGMIDLIADTGNVSIGADATVTVAALSGGGNAGTLAISSPIGSQADGGVTILGKLFGQGGAKGENGVFSLDAGYIYGGGVEGSLDSLDSILDTGGFTQSISIRDRSDPNVSINGTVTAGAFTLSVDQGSISVYGAINASNVASTDAFGNPISIGGSITLIASGDVTLEGGATLNASGLNYNNAGKGGSISLETTGGVLKIVGGSMINLSVAAVPNSPGAALQDATGTLYLQAPQLDGPFGSGNIIATNADNAGADPGVDLNIAPIAGTITGASSIVAAGFYVQDAATAGVASIDSMKSIALNNATTFMANATAGNVASRIIGGTPPATFYLEPGEEIENSQGSLQLNNDWNLAVATDRYGSNAAPGVLTLRAAGNLIFNGALSDGFVAGGNLWQEALLPAGSLSWSYNLVAGADFSAANSNTVVTVADIPASGASLELGKNDGQAMANTPGFNAKTSQIIPGFYQVIRTGVGNISISTAGDVDLLNQFATIYTAGTQVANPGLNGDFSLPQIGTISNASTSVLGAIQEPWESNTTYFAQYSYGGGNVSINAEGNIQHLTQDTAGNLVPDSEKELPINWLYRRGYVDPMGQFGVAKGTDIASTTWWVDFSNFFEGVGALGGGNVTMIAGGSINNVDAVVPTNERTTYQTSTGDKTAADQTNVELGGGDLLVRAGADINAGVYYVEQGNGALSAGGSIVTNSTRSPTGIDSAIGDPNTFLPTTLFLGAGSFNVSANGDVLLGPVANVFLLPEGYSNTYWYKTYFSTYAASDSVDVSSLTGGVTLREEATVFVNSNQPEPLLNLWLSNVSALTTTSGDRSVSDAQPWLRLDESDVFDSFGTNVSILPAALRVTAYAGDINIVGNLTLDPAPEGTLQLVAAGSVNGLGSTGLDIIVNNNNTETVNEVWVATQIDVSDANPGLLSQVDSPFAYQSLLVTQKQVNASYDSGIDFLQFIANLFNESGATDGQNVVLQTQQQLHDSSILHASDTAPLQVYAASGDISGITLFSPKQTRILAGTDITDVAFYIQNTSDSSLSIVSAGRDILPYDASAPLLIQAQAAGKAISPGEAPSPGDIGNELSTAGQPLPGDIQVSGPGTLEVLAGHDLTLGESPANPNADQTLGLGITTIGNARNPYLPFASASIIAAAGLGSVADGLSASTLDFKTFALDVLTSALGPQYFSDLSMADPTNTVSSIGQYDKLSKEQQDIVALDIFYLVLRDAGRDHNLVGNAGYGNYTAGMAAIAALFKTSVQNTGDMDLTSREIKTESGGNIDILVPGGLLTVGIETGGISANEGILTDDGGNISIFANGNVNVGTSRIFTLHGGNEIIWSSGGNIDAGAAAKTVQSAPPTRVLVDPQSGDVETDLAGLATGGGIGVLATVADVPPGSVDLIAPTGVIDAGDAGIRATGNLNLAATRILNASNIQSGGAATGVPVTVVAAPNIGAISAASAATGAGANSANQQTATQNQSQANGNDADSTIDVEVIGYGGGESDSTL